MSRLVALLLSLALWSSAAPRPSRAAEALWLGWEDCRSGSGLANQTFNCDQNEYVYDLICAFQPAADVSDVIGVEAVVDVQHASVSLPDWWRMGKGGCREGELFAVADFTTLGDCVDPWSGAASAEIQGYDIGQPHGAANQVRIRAVAGVLPAQAVALSADAVYYAVRIRFRTGLSAGPGACEGCLTSACLVLNGITIRRLPGSAGGDVTVVTPAPASSNWATWRAGTGADCGLVPVRAVTWGRIKALYR